MMKKKGKSYLINFALVAVLFCGAAGADLFGGHQPVL